MKHYLLALVLIFTLSCDSQQDAFRAVEKINYEQLLEQIQKKDDVLYLVNFWATWCVPCVEELPDFLEVNRKYQDQSGFQMYLISLDMSNTADSILPAYLHENGIDAQVLLLDDRKRMNTWIPAIDSTWSGAISATVIYKNGEKRFFIEGQLSQEQLENIINENL